MLTMKKLPKLTSILANLFSYSRSKRNYANQSDWICLHIISSFGSYSLIIPIQFPYTFSSFVRSFRSQYNITTYKWLWNRTESIEILYNNKEELRFHSTTTTKKKTSEKSDKCNEKPQQASEWMNIISCIISRKKSYARLFEQKQLSTLDNVLVVHYFQHYFVFMNQFFSFSYRPIPHLNTKLCLMLIHCHWSNVTIHKY